MVRLFACFSCFMPVLAVALQCSPAPQTRPKRSGVGRALFFGFRSIPWWRKATWPRYSSSSSSISSDHKSSSDDSSFFENEPSSSSRIPSNTVWSSTWFPLTFTALTDPSRPSRHYLLGAPIVVWKHNETWFAMLDKCPHRLVPLSEGRIVPETGDIECPYHGWSFEGKSGQCTRIPQLPKDKNISSVVQIKSRGCATALACAERQGMLWVHSAALFEDSSALPSTNTTDVVVVPDPNDISRYLVEPIDRVGVVHADYLRDLPMEWSTLAENVMDPLASSFYTSRHDWETFAGRAVSIAIIDRP